METRSGASPLIPTGADETIDWTPLAGICESAAQALGTYHRAQSDLRSLWAEFRRTRFPFAQIERGDLRWSIRQRAIYDIALLVARHAPPPDLEPSMYDLLDDIADDRWEQETVREAIRHKMPDGVVARGIKDARSNLHGILGAVAFTDASGPAIRLRCAEPSHHGRAGRVRASNIDALRLVGQMHWITHLGRNVAGHCALRQSACAADRLPGALRRLLSGGNPNVGSECWQFPINEHLRGWRIARGELHQPLRFELLLSPRALSALEADRLSFVSSGTIAPRTTTPGFPENRIVPGRSGRQGRPELEHA